MVKESKVFATSKERYRSKGETITVFIVGFEGSPPSEWQDIKGYGKTPGERKTYAMQKFIASKKV